MRALVIDDDPNITDMVSLFLRIEGFDVTVAGSGEDGLLAAFSDQPDVIVLDVMMPKVDGWQVASRLRTHAELADVPIVFCTALADDQSMSRGQQYGAAAYVTKPFDLPHLAEEVFRAVHADTTHADSA